jgi:hypothetical protein
MPPFKNPEKSRDWFLFQPIKMFTKKIFSKFSTPLKLQKSFKHDVALNLKFIVREDQTKFIERVTQKGTFIKESQNEDVYYDIIAKDAGNPYELGKKDIWLRKRNGHWECKVPQVVDGLSHIGKDRDYNTPIYTEAFGELSIRKELNLQPLANAPAKTLEQDLVERNFAPFATIKSTMKVFSIAKDVDMYLETTDFGYQYGIIKGEEHNAEEEDVAELVKKFEGIVTDLNLDVFPHAHDLVAEYLSRNSPAHYKELVNSKVFPDPVYLQKSYEKVVKESQKAPSE